MIGAIGGVDLLEHDVALDTLPIKRGGIVFPEILHATGGSAQLFDTNDHSTQVGTVDGIPR